MQRHIQLAFCFQHFQMFQGCHFNCKSLSIQILLGQREWKMHICPKKRYLRAPGFSISMGWAADLRLTHISAPTNALKTGCSVLFWGLCTEVNFSSKNWLPQYSFSDVCGRGRHHVSRLSAELQSHQQIVPGCSDILFSVPNFVSTPTL